MAKRRHGQEAELPFVALMDTMTNVVGVLTIVLVMMGISIAHAVKKILSDLPPATAAQVAEAQAAINKTKAEIAATQKKVAALPSLPDKGDIDAELIKLEAQLKEKNIKLFDLPVLAKEKAAKSGDLSRQETELSNLISERDRLRALLEATPAAKPPDAKIVRIPNSRDIPEGANIYHCFVRKDQIYFVDLITAKEMVMREFEREERNLVKQKIKVPKAKDRVIYDQNKVVSFFTTKPMEVRGQKITVPVNKYGSRLAVRIDLPYGPGDASLADMENPKGRFHALAYKLSSFPKVVLLFQVNPDGFATYLKAREIADRYRIPCGWEINGNTAISSPLEFEVNRLENPPPGKPPTGPPPPKRQLD